MWQATARAEDDHFWFKGLRRYAKFMLDAGLQGRSLRRILDCGAGTGRNLDWLKTYGDATGIELSASGRQVARAHGRRVGQATVAALPIATGSIDLVTSFDALDCR